MIQDAIARSADAYERYAGLQNGVPVFTDAGDLDAYLTAYGHMHYHKLADALQRSSIVTLAATAFELWDWGCGCGIGTFAVLDRLAEVQVNTRNLFRVVMIDPSRVALDRAITDMQTRYGYVMRTASLHRMLYRFDQITNGFAPTAPFANKLHILSNVVDLATVDIGMLATTLAQMFSGFNSFVIVSPANNRAGDRCEQFSEAIRVRATSFEMFDRDDSIRRQIYQMFPRPAAYRQYAITRRERQINATLP